MQNELSIELTAKFNDVLTKLDKLNDKLNSSTIATSKFIEVANNIEKITSKVEKLTDSVEDYIKTVLKINGEKSLWKDILEAPYQYDDIWDRFINYNTKVYHYGTNNSKAYKTFSNVVKGISFAVAYRSAKRLFDVFMNGIDTINNYTETLNLFNLVLDDASEKGNRFQNIMAEAFGNNTTNQLKYQALFQSMTESMGLTEKYAYIISENMTKMVYDISSLYDKDQEVVAEALRAGLVGQTKPIRNFGMDITQQSLQPILNELNIKKTIKDLSQVEKQILRYIALLRQSSLAHGDMANTIESPSNQLRVFKNQLIECQKWLSALFINTFARILPYANAILMVIKEISRALADFLGIEISDYNSGIASYEKDFIDLEDAVGDTTDKVKKLKREILGFDQINNINEPSNTGDDDGVSAGIDPRLLNAIEGYDNAMEKVRMKATIIRDKIMEWLGFTKKIDPLTREISFKYDGMKKTLSNLWTWFKKLSNTGKILVGLGLVIGATKLFSIGKKLLSLLVGNGFIKAIGKIASPLKMLPSFIDDINFANTGLIKGLLQQTSAWGSCLSGIERFKVGLIGAGGLLLSFDLIKKGFNDISENGLTLKNSLESLAGGLGSVVSGAIVGTSILPGLGTKIGAIVGVITAVVGALKGYKTENELLAESLNKVSDETSKYLDSLSDENNIIEENLVKNLAIVESNSKLVLELEKLVDANGNVKEGYEDRVKFILNELNKAYGIEYELVDGQIKNYSVLIDKIKEVLKTKKAEILLNANEEKYAKAVENETKLWATRDKNYQEYTKALDAYNKEYERQKEKWNTDSILRNEWEKSFGTTDSFEEYWDDLMRLNVNGVKSLKESLDTAEDNLNKATIAYQDNINTQITYSNLQEAVLTEDMESISKALEEYNYSYMTETGKEQLTMEQRLRKTKETADLTLKVYEENNTAITDEIRDMAYNSYEETISSLKLQSQAVEMLSPEIVDAWKTLGEQDREKFNTEISHLPEDVKAVLYTDQLKTIDDITSDVTDSYNYLALNNKDKYLEQINKLPEDIRGVLLGEQTRTISNITPEIVSSWGELSKTSKSEFERNINKLPEDVKTNLKQRMKDAGYDIGGNLADGTVDGMNQKTKSSSFWTKIGNFANSIISGIKSFFGIHSPSRKMIPIGEFLTLGLAVGMEEEVESIEEPINDMLDRINNKMKLGLSDLSIDSNVSASIVPNISNLTSSNNNFNIDSNYLASALREASYKGYADAIRDYGLVDVKINTRTEKGTIVETAINGIKEYQSKTGELPFEVY